MDAQEIQVLLVMSAVQVRARLSAALVAQGFRVDEAVNAVDALRLMAGGIPRSMVVGNRLPPTGGVQLVKTLGQLDKTKGLPVVLLVEDAKTLATLPLDVLRPSVIPVVQHRSLEALVEAICNAHEAALEKTQASAGDGLGLTIASREVEDLEQAFQLFDRVVDLVKRDKLPGPMMPDVLVKVRSLFADEDVPTRKVSDFVEQHQALYARLLKLANSVFYATSVPVKTAAQALSRLGLPESGAVLTAAATLSFVTGKDPMLRTMITSGLTRAYLVALAAEAIARRARFSEARTAFTVGLMHNIGGTFMLYTVALLQDKGQLGEIDLSALKTMIDSRIKQLNRLIGDALELPTEVKLVHSFTESDLSGPQARTLVTFIHRAMWVADRILEDRAERLELDAEAELVGLDAKDVEALNEELPRFQSLLAAYSA
jgi:HD-like signal output (HDOD) protein/ActR/RegA family two-component response regulator